MEYNFHITKGPLGSLGLSKYGSDILIVSDIEGKKTTGILIYPDKTKYKNAETEIKIPFTSEYKIGALYSVLLKDFPYDAFQYIFYKDGELVSDLYGKLVASSKKFGDANFGNKPLNCIYSTMEFDWENDSPLQIPYADTILYKLHMRGFSKHSTSRVDHKGTFSGLKEKVGYLKEIGITSVLSMPIFEFSDVIYNPAYSKIDDSLLPFLEEGKDIWKSKTNYWGYSDGHYFAPKKSYAHSDRPDIELKDLIKELHKNGIEFLIEFYFPAEIRPGFILEVCQYWVREYHVDGFKLMGCNIPVSLLVTDPYLRTTKLIFENYPKEELNNGTSYKNVGVVSPGFLYDIRKYLKGDEDMLHSVTTHFRDNGKDFGILNEISTYQGFTLADLVSYDRKHNEANGEDNKDGNDYNYSWNCGFEGKCRKKSVLSLREQQVRNALMMLFLSQGTPILLAGDEFGNSANGNNNPYCQDNAISWLEWKNTITSNELKAFTKELIAFRKAHPILHKDEPLRMNDYIAAGYPDISYHCEQAWYAGFENYNRHVGILYCGKYALINRTTPDDFIYVAYNTHWINHSFALPKLPTGFEWSIEFSSNTKMGQDVLSKDESGTINTCNVPPRTIVVLKSIEKSLEINVESVEVGAVEK